MPTAGAANEKYLLNPVAMKLRHIKLGDGTQLGSTQVLGYNYYPDFKGLNGIPGFQNGTYEPKMNEEGQFSLIFPNIAGQDGALHRDRFLVLDEASYRPGGEYIEIYRGQELVFVGVPTAATITFASIQISGYSPFWLLKKIREKAAGFWVNAPRDVLEHYLSVWQDSGSIDFSEHNAISAGSVMGTPWTVGENWITGSNGVLQSPIVLGTPSKLSRPLSLPQASAAEHRGWRIEIAFRLAGFKVSQNAAAYFALLDATEFENIGISFTITAGVTKANFRNGFSAETEKRISATALVDGTHNLAIERRDRWDYFYVDGTLLGYLAIPPETKALTTLQISAARPTTPSSFTEMEVNQVNIQRNKAWLFDPSEPGDITLPGAPPEAAIQGHYNNDQDIWQAPGSNTATKLGQLLHPLRESDPSSSAAGGMYAIRADQALAFSIGELGWMPTGYQPGGLSSCRWAGAVWLDLDNYDYSFAANLDTRLRMWIGKTRREDIYVEYEAVAAANWETGVGFFPWLKAGSAGHKTPVGSTGILSTGKSGWYPIIIEWMNTGGNGGVYLSYVRSDGVASKLANALGAPLANAVGTYSTPAASRLKVSPLGVYQQAVTFDSHYDAFQSVADSYGYQWTERFRPLESGFFPATIAPKARIGRDTDYVLDKLESSEVAKTVNADDVADALIGEAQGLGDPAQATQLTMELFNYPAMASHPFVTQEQESFSDINQRALLLQRADSLLALRSSPWEEVGARPKGTRRLADTFPLTGALAEFKWVPGDGLRLNFPEVQVVDRTPRQIVGIGKAFTPAGESPPTASFRQRPRNMALMLRKMMKDTVTQKRNYQGQLVVLNGQMAAPGAGAGADAFSRLALPPNLSDIVRATFVVVNRGNAEPHNIEVQSGLTGIINTSAGRYDVTPWVAAVTAATGPYLYARNVLTGSTADTAMIIHLELLVRV